MHQLGMCTIQLSGKNHVSTAACCDPIHFLSVSCIHDRCMSRLGSQVEESSPDEWEALCSEVQHALEEFINDMQLFMDTYDKVGHGNHF